MTQITFSVDDAVVASVGKIELEKTISGWLKNLKRKLDLEEAANELASLPQPSDSTWQKARKLAWETYKHNYENIK
jgi:hypothetical protein